MANVLGAHTEHGSNFIECALTFVGYVQSAVARRPKAVLAIAAVLEVIAAMSIATDSIRALVRALVDRGESARLPNRRG